jgi:hypothetical protein
MTSNARSISHSTWIASVLWMSACVQAQTEPTPTAKAPAANAEPWRYKLTASNYDTQGLTAAQDINLRGSREDTTWWVAHYRRASEFEQSRAGWEQSWGHDWGQLTSSLQVATRGFAGGAVTAQLGGESLHALVGWGRTNLKDYYNLNFDPNDAITLGLGGKLQGNSTYSLFTVKDDRLHTEQQISHAVLRVPLQGQFRLTLDYANKRGRASEQEPLVRGSSLAVGVDFKDVFLRLTADSKVNFTAYNQTRVALGWRF